MPPRAECESSELDRPPAPVFAASARRARVEQVRPAYDVASRS
ncbi:hypothetical protein [Prauserella muralis]|nr:hypothetical protein [Prauserella muralis]